MHSPGRTDNCPRESFGWLSFVAASLAGTLLSLAETGFLFATNNNLFHLPITARLYDEPQFASDAFVQSLRYFSSGIWILLRGSDRWIDPAWLFLILAFLTRFLTFSALLSCASLLDIKRGKERFFFAFILCATYLLRSSSFAGGGGLFSNCFTHSDIANGLFLLALSLLIQGRITIAIALTGVTFFANAFMGLWSGAVLGSVLLFQIRRGQFSLGAGLARAAAGLAIAGIFAVPILVSMLLNPEIGKPIDFDYIAYLKEFFPFHFLFNSNGARDKIMLAISASTGATALWLLGKQAQLLLVGLAASCAIYVLGIFVPELSQAPVVLNLHLLRSGAFVQLLSALGIGALTTAWFFEPDRRKAVFAAAFAISISFPSLISIGALWTLLLLLYVIADRDLSIFRLRAAQILTSFTPALKAAAIFWMAGVIGFVSDRNDQLNSAESLWTQEWSQIAAWARLNVPVNSIFLLPVGGPDSMAASQASGAGTNTIFEYAAHRKVWVDFKRGAAAMWQPSYYRQWHERVSEVLSLTTHGERLDYARRKKINYLVEACASRENSVFATGRLCVYAVTPTTEAAIEPDR